MRTATQLTASRPAVLRLLFALLVLASLAAGVTGGLVRAGVPAPSGLWLTPAVSAHAFLMICTFMGTVIGIERAVAVKHPLSFVGPVASAIAGIAMLAGASGTAAGLVAAASLAFVTVNLAVVNRQRAAHTVLLLVAAMAWAAGSVLYLLMPASAAVVPLWFSFLVLTVAAERLDMTRLMRRREAASSALYAICTLMLGGAALSAVSTRLGGALQGLSLVALSVWLVAFDIARRTVRAEGLSRYMAVCLLLGYAWLCVAGAAWVATSLGMPLRDVALHALALGFVFSMMLGHAPVILPAIARVKVLFGWMYYVPLLLLHGSLVLRLLAGHWDSRALAGGAAGNAVAIVVFMLTVAGSALAWRIRFSQPSFQHRRDPAAEH